MPALCERNYNPRNYLSIRYFFLSEVWRPLYKLSLQSYIVQYLVAFWFFSSTYSGFILDNGVIFRIACGTLILSYGFGFLLYMLIDRPVRNIDKLVLFPTKISDSFL
jgi:hypothetical protein